MNPWLPLLGLDREAVVLLLGCGQEHIAASLAGVARNVFVLGAVHERAELVRLRITSGELCNVGLVQASPWAPPFPEGVFDLIVAGGVLERVGGSLGDLDPRDAQLELLRVARRLLKPEGVLLAGAGNRFSWQGGRRRCGQPGAAAEGPLYPHTEAGYRKLLCEAGFQSSAFYWADPGHDQPYDLIPMDNVRIAGRIETQRAEPWLARRPGWKAAMKGLAARLGLLRRFVPEFVILARKDERAKMPGFWGKLRESIPELTGVANPVCTLSAQAFGSKSVIRVFEAQGREPCWILKTHTSAAGSIALERETNALRMINEYLGGSGAGRFAVPSLLGMAQVGPFRYCAESVARGTPLAGLIFRASGGRQLRVLEEHLPRCVGTAAELTRMLRNDARLSRVASSWWEIPAGMPAEATLHWQLDRLARESETAGWGHHGDFTVENIWVGPEPARQTIIDWEHLFRGGPPLYDVFTLLLSVLPAIPVASTQAGACRQLWGAHFEEAFFGRGEWSGRFFAWLSEACKQLDLKRADVWPMFLQSLLFRTHYLQERGSSLAGEHRQFLAIAWEKRASFLFAGSG